MALSFIQYLLEKSAGDPAAKIRARKSEQKMGSNLREQEYSRSPFLNTDNFSHVTIEPGERDKVMVFGYGEYRPGKAQIKTMIDSFDDIEQAIEAFPDAFVHFA